jgi:hypothetical protein
LQIADCRLQIADCRLATDFHFLSIIFAQQRENDRPKQKTYAAAGEKERMLSPKLFEKAA